mgnify:CR=1 FL=1
MIALQHIHAISSAEGPYCVLQKFNEHDHLKTQEALKLSFRASSLAYDLKFTLNTSHQLTCEVPVESVLMRTHLHLQPRYMQMQHLRL